MLAARVSVASSLVVVMLTPISIAGQAVPPTAGREFHVTNIADDGSPGTLRWAIDSSNATPERDTIAIDLAGDRVMTLGSPLPPIRGPVQIEGTAWRRTGEYSVIDGSGYVHGDGPEGCPGATPGQFGANVRTMTSPGLRLIDTTDVMISGVEVRRFCIGILINRASGVTIQDSRISGNRGGAGVMLTGDDGQGNPTSTTTVHNKVLRNEFVDNGDGLELTRGAAFNLIADNVFRSTPANPEPSQGIEILRGNDNVVSGNRFEGYSDGLQINWGDRNYIVANTFTANTFGLNLTGVGNIVDSNIIHGNRIGVVVRPADPSPTVRLTRNQISGNGLDIHRCEAGGSCDPNAPKAAMAFGLPGLEHESFVGSRGRGVTMNPATIQYVCPAHAPNCQGLPNAAVKMPTLVSARLEGGDVSIAGTFGGAPSSQYIVELFGNTDAVGSEAEVFITDGRFSTDATGSASFAMRVDRRRMARVQSITATITSPDGATSPLSGALPLKDLSR